MKYAVIIEHRKGSNYSAYAPDLPGCVAAGRTERATLKLMKETILMHQQDWKKKEARSGSICLEISKKTKFS
jgi:predicted RNase H-like HicB family nuclease